MKWSENIWRIINVGLLAIVAMLIHSNDANGQGTAITSVTGAYENGTQYTYSEFGVAPTFYFSSADNYNMVFGSNSTTNNNYAISPTSSFVAGSTFDFFQQAKELKVRRNAVSAVGKKEVIASEYVVLPVNTPGSTIELRTDYFQGAEIDFNSQYLNLSGDQTFVNTSSLSFSNIERLDYLFPAGLRTSNPMNSGFTVFERGGNDAFSIAAILDIDANGEPTKLGSILTVSSSTWGPGVKSLDQTEFYKEAADTYYKPGKNITGQSVHGVYVSFDELDIQANEVIYGYVLLGTDVTSNDVDWTNASIYPTGTTGSVGIDLCPGGGAFTSDGLLKDADQDDDGLADLLDTDDDNDGLLDVVETDCSIDNWQVGWFHSSGASPTIYTTDIVQTASSETYGSGVIGTIAGSLLTVSAISAKTLSEAKTNNEYVSYSFITQPTLSFDHPLSELTQYVHSSPTNTGHKMAVEISDDGFITSSLLFKDELSKFGGYYQEFDVVDHFYHLEPSTTYSMRIYLYDIPPANSGQAILDDFVLDICDTFSDYDEDGVLNHLDSDSDNDGIYDVFEAGGVDADADGYIGSGPITDTDGDGWSAIVDPDESGTILSDPDTDSDGEENRVDSDSDGDNCSDTIEAGFPDGDGDGQLGGLVPPTVNASGIVTSGGL